jgi:hypothetical protein
MLISYIVVCLFLKGAFVSKINLCQPMKMAANHMVLRVYHFDEFLLSQHLHAYRHLYLQPEVAEQLTYEALNAGKSAQLTLELQLVNAATQPDDATLKAMLHRHFAYRQRLALQQQKQVLKEGYKDLLIAFGFMLVMTSLYQLVETFMAASRISSTIQDALVILAWVAFWRPAELLLYEWHPHKQQAELYGRLAAMNVEVKRLNAVVSV